MSYFKLKNNANSTLASGINSVDVSMTVATGDGVKFPASGVFPVSIWGINYPDPSFDPNAEIAWCTSRADDTLTIVRNKEGTVGAAHALGANVAINITAGIFDDLTYGVDANVTADIATHAALSTGAHGVSGTIIGSEDKISALSATSSAELAGVISDESGSGSLVFGTSPTITTPTGIIKSDVGLGNVDNTSDANKPVSTAQQNALDLKLDLDGGTMSGNIAMAGAETVDGRDLSVDGSKLDGIESLADVNNISDANATDLTDSGNSALHHHTTDRVRANHTGTQVASTISDFDTEVSNNSTVVSNVSRLTAVEDDIDYPTSLKQKAIVDTGEDGGVEGGVFNGDFEYGSGLLTTTGWIGDEKYGWYFTRNATICEASYDSTNSHSGTQSIKIDAQDTFGIGVVHIGTTNINELKKTSIRIKPSTKYRVSGWVKTLNVPTDCTFLFIIDYDSVGTIGTNLPLTAFTGTNDWTYVEYFYTSPADAAYFRIGCKHDVAGNISTSWFDDVKLEQIDIQTVNTQMDEVVGVSIEGVTTTDNIDQFLETSGQTYTLTTGVDEGATHKQTFTPSVDRGDGKHILTKIQVDVVAIGTGDWSIEVHDVSNNVISSSTIVNGSMSTGDVDFNTPAIIDVDTSYHFHVYSTVADGTVTTTTLNDLETVDYHSQFAKHTESPIVEANGAKLDMNGARLLTGATITVNMDGSGRYIWDEQINDGGIIGIHSLHYTSVNNFDTNNSPYIRSPVDNILVWKFDFKYSTTSIRLLTRIFEGTERSGNIDYSFDNIEYTRLFTGDTIGSDSGTTFDAQIPTDGTSILYLKYDMDYISNFWLIDYITIIADLDCQAKLPIFAPSTEVSNEGLDLVQNPMDISEDGYWQLGYDLTGWGSRTITMIASEASWESQAVSADTIYIYDSNSTTPWTWDGRNGLVPPADRTTGTVTAKFQVGDNQIMSSVNGGSMKANVNLSWSESSIRQMLNSNTAKVNGLLDLSRLKVLGTWGQKGLVFDAANPPANGNVNGVPTVDFDDTTAQIVYFNDIHLPSDYNPETDITVYATFYMATATTGDVVLDVDYSCIGANEDIASAAFTNLTKTVTVPSTAGFRSGVGFTIPYPDFDASQDTIALKFRREAADGSDTATGDLRLLKLYVLFNGEVL